MPPWCCRNIEAEAGRQYATVEPQVHQVPPSGVSIIFKVDEGPKVKVNEINFTGNKVFSHRTLLRPMVNLHPYGIPHSIFLESLFPKAFDSTKLDEDEDRLTSFYRDQGLFHRQGAGYAITTSSTPAAADSACR